MERAHSGIHVPFVVTLLAVVLTYVGSVVIGVVVYRRVCHVTPYLPNAHCICSSSCTVNLLVLLGIEITDL